jgi:hypothetical protein
MATSSRSSTQCYDVRTVIAYDVVVSLILLKAVDILTDEAPRKGLALALHARSCSNELTHTVGAETRHRLLRREASV